MNKKKLYAMVLKTITTLFGVDTAKIFDALLRDHRKLNLKHPKTLADKVSWIELHDQSPLAPLCTDKYAVRQYVADKGLADILIPLAAPNCWTDENEINFESLPKSFILKATHGCKMNYIVPDKSELDTDACKKQLHKWLATTYGTYSMEPHYLSIPHRIYAEQYLKDLDGLIDYKFHCLNGVPTFVLVCSDRQTNGDKAMQVRRDLFDMNWTPINEIVVSDAEILRGGILKKPDKFNEMIEVSEKLSEDFKFVRVDLYEHNGQILFGELTFTPAHCVFSHFSDRFNAEMGEKLEI